jgi:hypothetical protein
VKPETKRAASTVRHCAPRGSNPNDRLLGLIVRRTVLVRRRPDFAGFAPIWSG